MKYIILLIVGLMSITLTARPVHRYRGSTHRHHTQRHRVHKHRPHRSHIRHRSTIIPFVSGVVGGYVVGSILNNTKTVVVTPQPTTTPQYVWVDGHYENRIQPNGVVLRVWVPYNQFIVNKFE